MFHLHNCFQQKTILSLSNHKISFDQSVVHIYLGMTAITQAQTTMWGSQDLNVLLSMYKPNGQVSIIVLLKTTSVHYFFIHDISQSGGQLILATKYVPIIYLYIFNFLYRQQRGLLQLTVSPRLPEVMRLILTARSRQIPRLGMEMRMTME